MSRGRLFLMPNRAGWLGPNLLLNPGFETGGTGGDFDGGAEIDDGASDNFANWVEGQVDDGAGNKCEATATAHVPSAVAVKLTNTTLAPSVYQTFTVIPGVHYASSFWTRGDGAQQGQYRVYDVSNAAAIIADTPTGVAGVVYTQVSAFFTAPGGCTLVYVLFIASSVAGVCYFDDASVKGGY